MRNIAEMTMVLCRVHLCIVEGAMHVDVMLMDDLGTVLQ